MIVPKPKKLASGYAVYLRLGGENVTAHGMTAKEATREAQRIKADYLSGKRLEALCASKKTIKQAALDYIADRSSVLSPATLRGYSYIIERHSVIMQRRVDDPINWQAVLNEAASRYSSKTLKNDFGFISSVLKNEGVKMPDLRYPQQIKEPGTWLTPEQIPDFVVAIQGKPWEIGALLGLHGLRRSELLAVEKKNVRDGLIHVEGAIVLAGKSEFVRKETNKNQSSRRSVPIMIPRLSELIADVPDGPLYTGSPNSIYKGVNAVCRKHGWPEVGCHGLRRSFASLCYHMGLSAAQTQELGGWSDPATMRKIYIQISDADKAAAAEKLRSFFKNANENANE